MATKLDKIAKVMQKAEEFAAGLAAVTRNLYINALGPEEAQKVFEVMLESFIVADEIIDGVYTHQKPTIH